MTFAALMGAASAIKFKKFAQQTGPAPHNDNVSPPVEKFSEHDPVPLKAENWFECSWPYTADHARCADQLGNYGNEASCIGSHSACFEDDDEDGDVDIWYSGTGGSDDWHCFGNGVNYWTIGKNDWGCHGFAKFVPESWTDSEGTVHDYYSAECAIETCWGSDETPLNEWANEWHDEVSDMWRMNYHYSDDVESWDCVNHGSGWDANEDNHGYDRCDIKYADGTNEWFASVWYHDVKEDTDVWCNNGDNDPDGEWDCWACDEDWECTETAPNHAAIDLEVGDVKNDF